MVLLVMCGEGGREGGGEGLSSGCGPGVAWCASVAEASAKILSRGWLSWE